MLGWLQRMDQNPKYAEPRLVIKEGDGTDVVVTEEGGDGDVEGMSQ